MKERQERAETVYNLAYDLLSSDNYSPSDEQVQAHVLKIETGLGFIPTDRLREMFAAAIVSVAPKSATIGDIAREWRVRQNDNGGHTTQAAEPEFEADRDGPGATAAKLQMLRFARGMGIVVCSCKTRYADKSGNEHFYTVTATLSKDKKRWVCAGPDRKPPLCDQQPCYFAKAVSEQEWNILAQNGGKSVMESFVPESQPQSAKVKEAHDIPSPVALSDKTPAWLAPVKATFEVFLLKCGYDADVLTTEEKEVLRRFYDWCQKQTPIVSPSRKTFEECWKDYQFAVAVAA